MSMNNQKEKKWTQNTAEAKKMARLPHRTQINLKARKKNIPEIKIELDQMLMQAYQQMKMQPKKSMLLGNPDLYVLDNQLLRDYVTAVYDQYGIEDPIHGSEINHFYSVSDRLRSSSILGSRSNATPQKIQPIHHINQANSKIKKTYKISEKIAQLKQQFQTELQTMPTMLIEAPKTPTKKGVMYSENRPTPKKVQIKISRRSSQIQLTNSVKVEGKRKSKILNQSRHKYCLMCQELLQSNEINAHQKQCGPLQQLLNTPNLTIEQVVQVLNSKIKKLTEQLQWHRSCLQEDLCNMQSLIHSQLKKYQTVNKNQVISWESQKDQTYSRHANTEESQQYDEDHENLMKQFSQMRSIKVLEILDKVSWFNKMKIKALQRKQKAGKY